MTEAGTHVFRVSLWGERSISRDIEVESSKSLYHLAQAIVRAFDFDFDHAFGFYSGKTERTMMKIQPKYELFTDMPDMGMETDARSVKKTKIGAAFPEVGYTLAFLFDYGDGWLFRIQMIAEGQKAAKARYPKVIAKKGPSPTQYPDPDDEEYN